MTREPRRLDGAPKQGSKVAGLGELLVDCSSSGPKVKGQEFPPLPPSLPWGQMKMSNPRVALSLPQSREVSQEAQKEDSDSDKAPSAPASAPEPALPAPLKLTRPCS